MTVRAFGSTTILGAGPAGLAAALGHAGRGDVRIIAPTLPAATDAPRVDMVPAAFLAFLLELGIHPAQIGVSDLHDVRMMAWGNAMPETVRGNAMAHIERPALELALLAAAQRLPAVRIVTASQPTAPDDRMIDATGRRAVTATRTVGLSQPWIARVFSQQGRFDKADQAFRMAALPAGYCYRMATPRLMTIGVVLSKAASNLTAQELDQYIHTAGAGWLLDGIGCLGSLRSGRGGVASVQWTVGSTATERVGDALLARDSLSAQGLCIGLSNAVATARNADPSKNRQCHHREQLQRHLGFLAGAIEGSRFRGEPAWDEYHRFVRLALRPADPLSIEPHPTVLSN
jgi:hypothetical protein